jgi:DNA ligase-4
MLKLFDERALDLFNSCSSLQRVCEEVARPPHEAAARPMRLVDYFAPCKPMLASNPPWHTVIQRMKGHRFIIEDKFDGERILVHKRGAVIKLFTRKSVDTTERFNYGGALNSLLERALAGCE